MINCEKDCPHRQVLKGELPLNVITAFLSKAILPDDIARFFAATNACRICMIDQCEAAEAEIEAVQTHYIEIYDELETKYHLLKKDNDVLMAKIDTVRQMVSPAIMSILEYRNDN